MRYIVIIEGDTVSCPMLIVYRNESRFVKPLPLVATLAGIHRVILSDNTTNVFNVVATSHLIVSL